MEMSYFYKIPKYNIYIILYSCLELYCLTHVFNPQIVCHFTDDSDGFSYRTFSLSLSILSIISIFCYVFNFHSEGERWLQSPCWSHCLRAQG